MTTDKLLAIVARRGLKLVLRADGRPALTGPADLRQVATEGLLAVLKLPVHREAIIARLGGSPPPPPAPEAPNREYLWRFGHRQTLPASFKTPAGAWWWRHEGESTWSPVPGTPGESESPPEGA
jgi:hypothetical protein